MRVCLVSSELAPFRGWGVGAATASLALALREAGHEVHLLIDDLPGLRERGGLEFPGIHIHILEPADFAAALDQVPAECTRRPLVVYRRLADLHTRLKFDAIEFNDFFADAYFVLQARRVSGLFAEVRVAIHLHSPILLLRHLNQQPDYDLDIALINSMEAACLRGADLLFAPSHAIVAKLREFEGLTPALDNPGRVAIIPYALPPIPAATPSPPTEALEVLFFGRLETRKGIQTLIDAAQRLFAAGEEFRVRIVGVDTDCGPGRRSMRDHLRRRIEPQWRTRFIFEDNQPREVLADYIRKATLCCFPAIWDNYPNACLEAMAMGACIIASNAGGMAEMIEHGVSGLLVPPNDAPALAEALRLALADLALRRRLGEHAATQVRAMCEPASIAARHLDALAHAPSAPSSLVARSPTRVAAIIPVFNLGRTLPATVESLRRQTCPPDEIILVNDGSTDSETLNAIARFERQGVRVVHQRNQGLAAARNVGLTATDAPWVLPLDADDLLAPAFIERCLEAAARNPSAVLVTSHMTCFHDHPARPTMTYVPLGFVREVLPAANVASSAIALMRREAVLAVGGYDPAMVAFEDWEMYCRLAAAGHEAVVIPEPLIHNRIRPDSMLRSLPPVEDQTLCARILERHMNLSPRPDRTARIILARSVHASEGLDHVDDRARALIRENLRYRLADRVHQAASTIGVKDVLKQAVRRAAPPATSSDPTTGG
ncbi:MAG: hypothetical protein HBSAPP03_24010 [Phycisphaerae bacterium]|nr:MAG: hypothetical protein HBSAPP03_24010 [Phycisphaerae bacterium]